MLLSLIALFYRRPWDSASRTRPQHASAPARCRSSQPRSWRGASARSSSAAAISAGLDAAALHALRIDIKKARYAAEFFSSLYDGKAVRGYTDALAQLQSLLGGLNDAATVERLCEQLRPPPDNPDGTLLEAIGLVRGWAVATARAHLESLPAAWEAFRDAKKFW